MSGVPARIKVNNGPDFISRALDAWAHANGVKLEFSRPGKPTDNQYIESFNGRFRSPHAGGVFGAFQFASPGGAEVVADDGAAKL